MIGVNLLAALANNKLIMPVSYLCHQMFQIEKVNSNNIWFFSYNLWNQSETLKNSFYLRWNIWHYYECYCEKKGFVFPVMIYIHFDGAHHHGKNNVLTKLKKYDKEIYLELIVLHT